MGDVPIHHWDRCQGYIDKFVTEASRLVTRCRIDEIEKGIGCIGIVIKLLPCHCACFIHSSLPSTDSSYVQFFGDDFLRTLILRFVFCDVVLRIHRSFRGRHQRPRCEPPLPTAELLEHPSLSHIILQLATALDVRSHFNDVQETEWCMQLSVRRLVCLRIAHSTLYWADNFRSLQFSISRKINETIYHFRNYCFKSFTFKFEPRHWACSLGNLSSISKCSYQEMNFMFWFPRNEQPKLVISFIARINNFSLE